MTKDEFAGLSSTDLAHVLLQILPAVIVKKIEGIDLPETVESPMFDLKIYRKNGFHQWASEMDLEGLQFWQGLAQKSADGGGQYADKDAKKVEAFQIWINYREKDPTSAVTVTRGEVTSQASPPSGRPQQYKAIRNEDREPARPPEDDDMSDIPFE